jgi:DNA-binding response OmpR family regulator
MTMYILLIENNTLAEAESLIPCLEEEGHQVCVADTPQAAAATVRTYWPNLIVFNPVNFNEMLPAFQEAIDTTELQIPYVILSNEKFLPPKTDDRATLLAASNKPQLLKTIKKVGDQQQDRFIRLSNLVIDCHQYQILRDEVSHSLTPKQFKLLHLLLENPDQVLSRKTIMRRVWETDYLGDTRTLDVHIRWLREKIEKNPSQPRHLITVRGVGYHFVTEPD